MVRFLTLTGDITGSARLNIMRGRLELCLNLRGRVRGSLRAFITDGKGVKEVELSGGCGTTDSMDVRAIMLTGEMGEVLATGSSGMSAKELEGFRTRIRFIINSERENKRFKNEAGSIKNNGIGRSGFGSKQNNACASAECRGRQSMAEAEIKSVSSERNVLNAQKRINQSSEKGADVPRNYNIVKPQSAAAANILDKAVYLFHGEIPKRMDMMNNERPVEPDNDIAESGMVGARKANPVDGFNAGNYNAHEKNSDDFAPREAVENPFPSFFNNSYWWKDEGDERRIHGVANVRGIKYRVIAVRSNAKYPPNGMGRNARRLLSMDGKRFWVGMSKL